MRLIMIEVLIMNFGGFLIRIRTPNGRFLMQTGH